MEINKNRKKLAKGTYTRITKKRADFGIVAGKWKISGDYDWTSTIEQKRK